MTNCEDCLHWRMRKENAFSENGDAMGECHAWPPKVVVLEETKTIKSVFPLVEEDNFCSLWTAQTCQKQQSNNHDKFNRAITLLQLLINASPEALSDLDCTVRNQLKEWGYSVPSFEEANPDTDENDDY